MTTRLLPMEEWDRVAGVLVDMGGALPHAETAQILVTEDEGRIVAFLVLQLVPHVEPLWVDPAYRGKASWLKLLRAAEALMTAGAYYVFAPSERIEQLAHVGGLTPLDWRVYEGKVH